MSTTEAPLIGATSWDGKAQPGDRTFVSGSSLGFVINKPGVNRWMVNNTADWAIDNVTLLPAMLEQQGRDEMRRILGAASSGTMTDDLPATERGTLIHDHLAWQLGVDGFDGVDDVRIDPWLPAADDFADTVERTIAGEYVVYNTRLGTAGRPDAMIEFKEGSGLPPGRWLVDFKSKSAVDEPVHWDSNALQLWSYGTADLRATFPPRVIGGGETRTYLLNAAEEAECQAAPTVSQFAVVVIAPDGWRFVPMPVIDGMDEFTRSFVNMHRWLQVAATFPQEGVRS